MYGMIPRAKMERDSARRRTCCQDPVLVLAEQVRQRVRLMPGREWVPRRETTHGELPDTRF